jgi:hypothetical protein
MSMPTNSPIARAVAVIGITASALIVSSEQSVAKENTSWSPRITERLVKLPGSFVKKTVENDFARSGLATKLADTADQITYKRETLTDLQEAIESAEGELKTELEHQLLTEKRSFINLMRDYQEIRRKKSSTKIRLYSGLLKKLKRSGNAKTATENALVNKQKAAKQRFEQTFSDVDNRIMAASSPVGSKYGREYEKNLSAIRKLSEALKSHTMNRRPEILGTAVTRENYLRQLLTENQGEIALLDQEAKILSFMAKLVSLDALSIAERAMEGSPANTVGPSPENPTPANTINLFIPSNS